MRHTRQKTPGGALVNHSVVVRVEVDGEGVDGDHELDTRISPGEDAIGRGGQIVAEDDVDMVSGPKLREQKSNGKGSIRLFAAGGMFKD